MPIRYKFDVLPKLKNSGYSTYRIRKEKIFSEGTLQKFRSGEIVGAEILSDLCKIFNCQPGDILEYIPDESKE